MAQAWGNESARSRQPFRATLKPTVWNCKMVICSLRTVASTCEGVMPSFGQTADSAFQSSASWNGHICWLYKITSDNSDRLPTSTAVLDANHILVYQTPRQKESCRTKKKFNTLSSIWKQNIMGDITDEAWKFLFPRSTNSQHTG